LNQEAALKLKSMFLVVWLSLGLVLMGKIENWGKRNPNLRVNGKKISEGKACRFGFIRRIKRYDLVVWIELTSEQPVEISLN
jgi:hypothetical protein